MIRFPHQFAHRLALTWPYLLFVGGMFLGPFLVGIVAPAPLLFPVQPLVVQDATAGPGGLLTIIVTRCNNQWDTVAYTTDWQLVRNTDNFHVILATGGGVADPGCATYAASAQLVPKGTPPGRYHIEGISTVHSPIRTYTTHFVTTSFLVEGEKGAP